MSTTVTPTLGQRTAIETIQGFMSSSSAAEICAIAGRAGTGKTTLLAMIRDKFRNAIIAAPTNKAVNVLRQKGFAKATTIDRVINHSVYQEKRRPPSDAEIAYFIEHEMDIPETVVEESYEKIVRADNVMPLLLVDEASMVDYADLKKIIAAFPKTIFVGDPFQLPPVDGMAWFQTWTHDVQLDEIVRTSNVSEITLLANMIRDKNPKWASHAWTREVTIIKQSSALGRDDLWINSDIMLAHQNITCNTYNSFIRSMRGRDDVRPVAGDKLLAWQAIRMAQIIKSDIYDVVSSESLKAGGYLVRLRCPNTDNVSLVNVSKAMLMDQKTGIQVPQMHPFSFAHCITGHKSQGSEWDNIVVLAFDKSRRHEDYWNWLYTSVSRAKKHLTVVV